MERSVRNSAKALIISEGRLLAVRLRDKDGDFYILPGGGQEPGELLPQTVEREVAEELGIRVRAKDVAFVIEGAQGERHHRVDLVFSCEYLGESAHIERHPDTNQVGWDWLDIRSLNTAPLYPSKLRRPIMHLASGEHPAVYLGNENMGDPEVTE